MQPLRAILLLGFAATAATAAATTPHLHPGAPAPNGAAGTVVSLTQAGFGFVSKQVLDPLLASYLNDLKIAEIDTEKDHVKIYIRDIYTHAFSCGADCVTVALVPGQGLHVQLSNFFIQLHSDVKLKWGIVSDSCHCDSKLKNADLSMLLSIDVGADGHPTLKAGAITAALSDIDLNCNGVAGNILDALAWAFKSKVVDALQSAVDAAMPKLVAELTERIANVSLDIPLDDHGPGHTSLAEIRFELAAPPTVAAGYVAVPTLGAVAPVADPGQVAPYPIPDLPLFDAALTADYVQVFISDFTLNSALYTYWKAGQLHHTVTEKDLPAGAPLQLNTSALAVVAPGLAIAYPTAVPVQIYVQADPFAKPSVAISAGVGGAPGNIVVSMQSLLSFQPLPTPGNPVDGFTLSCPMVANANMSITGQIVSGDLFQANCTLSEYNSTVGAVNLPAVNALSLLVLNDLVLPAINTVANAGFALPSVDHFELSKPTVTLHDTYAAIGSKLAPVPKKKP